MSSRAAWSSSTCLAVFVSRQTVSQRSRRTPATGHRSTNHGSGNGNGKRPQSRNRPASDSGISLPPPPSSRTAAPPATSPDELFEELAALPQGAAAGGQRVLERPVLDLHAHRAVVVRVRQRREELAPPHVAQPRQLRHVPPQPQDAHLVEPGRIDPLVLRVDVD